MSKNKQKQSQKEIKRVDKSTAAQKTRLSEKQEKELVKIGYIVFAAYLVLLSVRYLHCFYWIEKVVITTNGFLIALLAIAPFVLWIDSTKFSEYNYRDKKRHWFYVCCFAAVATINQITLSLSYEFFAKPALQKTVTENMTEAKILLTARVGLLIPVALTTWIFAIPIKAFLMSEIMKDRINNFRITHHIDTRENKETKYDLSIVNDLNTGKPLVIKEDDRFLHTALVGQTGTGKTSSTFLTGIAEDLNRKTLNLEIRHLKLCEMLKNGQAYVAGPYADVNEYNVKPKKGYIKKYQEIYKTFPDAGMTVIAPNPAMNNTIIKLCEARGQKVNVIDPSKTYKSKYALARGIQNFFIPEDISEEERVIRIKEQASTFAEVLQATNEKSGTPDIYFRDINTSVTTNVAIVVMLAASIEKRQANINEVYRCINNFDELKPLVGIIENHYGFKVPTSDNIKTNDQASRAKKNLQESKNKTEFETGRDNAFYETIFFVNNELLGPGREKMYDQARGLRNLIGKVLLDPRYRKILSAPYEQSVDFDRMLDEGEVTIVNTALEYGSQGSTALGLFFLLNFKTAVLRRPEENRSNHFLWIDEASQYAHPIYEDFYALFRQYRCGVSMAIQTLSQFEKNKSTAYLSEVIQGAGTQIVFGRVGSKEMKLYSEIAGMDLQEVVQERFSQTSLFEKNVSQTQQRNVQTERVKNLEGTQIRNKEFQEITIFKVDQGRVLAGMEGRVFFLDPSELKPRKVKKCNFIHFAPKGAIPREKELTPEAKDLVAEQAEIIKKAAEKLVISTIDSDSSEKEISISNTEDLLQKSELEVVEIDSRNQSKEEDKDEVDKFNAIEDVETKEHEEDVKKTQMFDFGSLFESDRLDNDEQEEELITEDELGAIV